jgi:hypothetical protein
VRSLRTAIVPILLATAAAGGCAARTSSVFGRPVTLVPQGNKEPKVRGELLAVDDHRAYVRTRDGVREIDLASLREVRVQRHGWTAGRALTWGAVGGLLSGVGLAAACSSVEGNSSGGCAGVGAVAAGIWLGMSTIAAASFSSSASLPVAPWEQELRRFARFPAGLPKDVAPQTLAAGPPAPR